MIEEYRLLEKEHEYLKDSYHDKEGKFVQDSHKAEESIQKLEETISQLFGEKEHLQKKTDERVKELERLLADTEK